jgi:hypothetical protein
MGEWVRFPGTEIISLHRKKIIIIILVLDNMGKDWVLENKLLGKNMIY